MLEKEWGASTTLLSLCPNHPGDIAEVEIVTQKKNFLRGKLVSLERPSPDRMMRRALTLTPAVAASFNIWTIKHSWSGKRCRWKRPCGV